MHLRKPIVYFHKPKAPKRPNLAGETIERFSALKGSKTFLENRDNVFCTTMSSPTTRNVGRPRIPASSIGSSEKRL